MKAFEKSGALLKKGVESGTGDASMPACYALDVNSATASKIPPANAAARKLISNKERWEPARQTVLRTHVRNIPPVALYRSRAPN